MVFANSHCVNTQRVKSVKSISCSVMSDPMDYSLPGSSVHGILQVRILEWIAIPFSRDLPNPGIKLESPSLQVDSLPSESSEKPKHCERKPIYIFTLFTY